MHRIGQVAARLDLSPSTLRRLSDRYAAWLSDEAGSPETLDSGRSAPRRYTDLDVEILEWVQALRQAGLDDAAIDERLQARYEAEEAGGALTIVEQDGQGDALMTRTAAAALGQALNQLSETQQALLNSQQAHRELLSVVINDAMSLKDENERLRKRLRMIEEEMARLKESDWNHRLSLEERMGQVERQQHEKKQRPWWQRLFGQ